MAKFYVPKVTIDIAQFLWSRFSRNRVFADKYVAIEREQPVKYGEIVTHRQKTLIPRFSTGPLPGTGSVFIAAVYAAIACESHRFRRGSSKIMK